MKKTSTWCLLALLSLVSVAGSQTGGGTEKAVAALEQQWLQGQKTNNPDLVARCWPTRSWLPRPMGKCDTAGALAIYKKTKWDSAEYYDVKVTVFGDTAIATGGFKGKGIDGSGKAC